MTDSVTVVITDEPVELSIDIEPVEVVVESVTPVVTIDMAPIELMLAAEVTDITISPVGEQGPPGRDGDGINDVWGETPTGAINGANEIFTTALDYRATTTRLYLNGLRQTRGSAYTEDAPNILTLSFAPEPGDELTVDYIRL